MKRRFFKTGLILVVTMSLFGCQKWGALRKSTIIWTGALKENADKRIDALKQTADDRTEALKSSVDGWIDGPAADVVPGSGKVDARANASEEAEQGVDCDAQPDTAATSGGIDTAAGGTP